MELVTEHQAGRLALVEPDGHDEHHAAVRPGSPRGARGSNRCTPTPPGCPPRRGVASGWRPRPRSLPRRPSSRPSDAAICETRAASRSTTCTGSAPVARTIWAVSRPTTPAPKTTAGLAGVLALAVHRGVEADRAHLRDVHTVVPSSTRRGAAVPARPRREATSTRCAASCRRSGVPTGDARGSALDDLPGGAVADHQRVGHRWRPGLRTAAAPRSSACGGRRSSRALP